jgi:hypothetical protein
LLLKVLWLECRWWRWYWRLELFSRCSISCLPELICSFIFSWFVILSKLELIRNNYTMLIIPSSKQNARYSEKIHVFRKHLHYSSINIGTIHKPIVISTCYGRKAIFQHSWLRVEPLFIGMLLIHNNYHSNNHILPHVFVFMSN